MHSSQISRRALKRRVAACRPRLYRLAWSWCHDAALADDLVRETLTRGLARLDQLRDPARLDVWLCRILVNVQIDLLRRNPPETSVNTDVLAPPDQPESAAEQAEFIGRVYAAMACLSVDQRRITTLVDLMELSYAEVAEVLQIAEATVMRRLYRARRRLRDLLDNTTSAGNVIPIGRVRR
jgi:RNA polymerase sigma-70 factor (ECF subfamily)